VDIAAIATGLGCEARRIDSEGELVATLDEVVPALRDLEQPLLLEVAVTPDSS
jgi:thiamine pyrophosphate-dependent acetolactate synthase large subunit-like protein